MEASSLKIIFVLYSLMGISFCATFESNLNRILETSSAKYFLSNEATDPETATQICQSKHGHLISIENLEENLLVSEKLRELGIETVWLSGIKFSNATIEDLYYWVSTGEQFSYTNFHESPGEGGESANMKHSVRDRRSISTANDDCCDCNSPTTLPPPFTPPPCKVPKCEAIIPQNPICQQQEPQQCIVSRAPICSSKRDNCSVECGAEKCRILKQPVCTIKLDQPPRCRLESNLGKCETGRPKCTVIKPGNCVAHQDPCFPQDNTGTCEPDTTQCKYPCLESCETIQPPCTTTQPPCSVTPTCPTPPPCHCKPKDRFCKCPTPTTCVPVTTCPPPEVTCPPPVTSCKRPFVDCSPEVCRSSVQICRPPKMSCPPPRIICGPPEIKCDEPTVKCPTPEVICEEPEIECSRPIVECPDASVHCDPILTTCESPPYSCSDPVMDCQEVVINCEPNTVCKISRPAPTRGPCICVGGKAGKCPGRGRGKRETPIPETEFVETKQCVAMRKDLGFKWDTQNCDIKHRFICEERKVVKRSVLDFLF